MPSEGRARQISESPEVGTAPIFLSYSRKDRAFVDRLAHDLKVDGIAVWIDQSGIQAGKVWDVVVQGALDDASQVIVVLSPDSVMSRNVLDEVSSALDSGKNVIPVLHRACNVPLRLRRVQYIDFQQDYTDGLAVLKAALSGKEVSFPSIASKGSGTLARNSKKTIVAASSIAAVVLLVVGLWLWIASHPSDSQQATPPPKQDTSQGAEKQQGDSGAKQQTNADQTTPEPRPKEGVGQRKPIVKPPIVTPQSGGSNNDAGKVGGGNSPGTDSLSSAPKPDPAMAAELSKLQVELDQTKGEAQAVTEYWTNMGNQLSAQHLSLRPDVKAAMASMNQSLASSSKFIDAGNATGAEMSLKNANDQLEKLKAAENR